MTDSERHIAMICLLSDLVSCKEIISANYRYWIQLQTEGLLIAKPTKKQGRKAFIWKATKKGIAFMQKRESEII